MTVELLLVHKVVKKRKKKREKRNLQSCYGTNTFVNFLFVQTGAGKTYTMGTGFDVTVTQEEEGIIPRAVAHLFEGIDRRKQDAKQRNEPQPDFKVTVQFMEVCTNNNFNLHF